MSQQRTSLAGSMPASTGSASACRVFGLTRGGFANVCADLLFGVPGVNLTAWLDTLESVLAEGVQHLSAYELTVESGTRLGQEVRTGLVQMPGEDDQLEQYWAAAARLETAGYAHYEISNWSRPGFACLHNLPAGT